MAHQHHVLIADDDLAFRWALAVRCYRRKLEVDVAENGHEALDLVTKRLGQYCCIILDLKMPRHDGTAVLDMLSASASAPPVVVVTGYPDALEDMVSKAKHGLVAETLLKPVDVDVVISAAEKHCAHA
jgi:two-component system, OmpR family, copper resistance phosphate regulon response regulator CusR